MGADISSEDALSVLNPGATASDRRQSYRKPCRASGMLMLAGTRPFPIKVIDISAEGLGVVCEQSIPNRTRCAVRITVENYPSEPLVFDAIAETRHPIFSQKEEGWKIGLLFLDVTFAHRDVLNTILAR